MVPRYMQLRRLSVASAQKVGEMTRGTAAFAMGQASPRMCRLPANVMDGCATLVRKIERPELKAGVERLLAANRTECAVHAKYFVDRQERCMLPHPDMLPREIADYSTDVGVAAYVAWQMPLAYASVQRVLTEILKRMPSFYPQSILDYGSGPGTASFAAAETFGTITSAMAVDVSENMLMAAQQLWTASNQTVELTCRRTLPPADNVFDMVVASHALSELAADTDRLKTLAELWKRCRAVMVVVERGTPEGARVVAEARKALLTVGEQLHIVAPCSHDKPCPMKGSWCHFAQRVEITGLQMETHAINKGFEDQKLSYLVVSRGPRPKEETSADGRNLATATFSWPRLIRRPLKRHGHIVQDYCSANGTFERTVVSRSAGKDVYYDARKARWGDLWPHPPQNAVRTLDTMAIKRSTPKTRQKYKDDDELEDEEDD